MLQLVWGLYSSDIQEKVLAAGAALEEGKEMHLSDVIKMVEAMEMGKTTQALVSGSGAACRLSDHQKKKQVGRDQNRNQRGGRDQCGGQREQRGNTGAGDKKCSFCGHEYHERDKCPAKT